jgi:Enterobacterial TraT complement resistance protein
MKLMHSIAAAGLAISLAGCAATQVAISKRNLDVQNKMTDTIFLDPVSDSQRTIYLQVRNTSDQPGFDLAGPVNAALTQKGYRVVNSLDQAHYLLQANVLQVGKTDPSAAEKSFAGGYGSIVGSAAAGAAVGGLSSGTGALAGGLAAGVISTIADAAVKDVTYTIITDLQVSERTNLRVTETTNQRLQQGRSGTRDVYASETTNWKRYQTRIMSTANKVNLDLPEALPALTDGTTRSIAGMF